MPRASAVSRVPPSVACAAVLAPANLPKWWAGGAVVVAADPSWPQTGTTMAWKAGGWLGGRFLGRVLEDARPGRVVIDIVSPTGRSHLTHRFVALDGGGSRVEMDIEMQPEGAGWLIRPLFDLGLRVLVRGEVARAAQVADGAQDARKA